MPKHQTTIEYVQPNEATNERKFTVTPQDESYLFEVETSAEGLKPTRKLVRAGDHPQEVGGVQVEVQANQGGVTVCVVKPISDLGGRGGGQNLVRDDMIIGYHIW
ncbi:MAG: hypothetical protein AAGN66_06140 [Acidobacteriota bacterium]